MQQLPHNNIACVNISLMRIKNLLGWLDAKSVKKSQVHA
jgi:hypothetical protein